MKLHPIQRLAFKLGVPIKVLNVFAQEFYGYAIPNAEGKYPDWWYEQQGVPTTFRDCEVPEEVLKKYGSRRNRGSMPPKVYVRVSHGKVVEVVANSALESEPNLAQYRGDPGIGYPQTIFTRERYEVRQGEGGDDDVETDEIITRVVEMRRSDGGPMLNRSTSAPIFSPSTRSSDIMSLIREERMPTTRRATTVRGMVNPEPLLHDTTTAGAAFSQPHRSATMPIPRASAFPGHRPPVPPPGRPSGPGLPSNPRPVRHERTQTSVTDDTVLGYYYSPAAGDNSTPHNSYGRPQERQFRPMEGVEEDAASEWSGYESVSDDDEAWEDVDEFGMKADYRRTAAERLREYRREN
jgi:hypothetical protein